MAGWGENTDLHGSLHGVATVYLNRVSRPLAMLETMIGATVAGAMVGLVEVAWLWSGAGVDVSMLPWGVGLYGLAGLGVGVAVGVGVIVAMAIHARACWWAGGSGFAIALLGIGAVVGRYVLNRDVFAEQGVPLWGLGVLAVGLLVIGLVAAAWSALKLKGEHRFSFFRALGLGWPVALLVTIGVGALGATLEPPIAPPPSSTRQGPNVVFVLVDTFRADHLDRPELDTPHLDGLRADSITFTNAWSSASWTRPGVASLWTSRSPSNHTATQKGSRLPEAVVTWAEVLRGEGVTTGALVNNINVTRSFGFDQGFDTFHYEAPRYPFGASEGVFNLALYKVLHRVEERLTGGGGVERYYAPGPQVVADGLAWIENADPGSWALSLHLMEPHDPYFDEDGRGYSRAANPQPDPAEADDLRRLYGVEVERLDAVMGSLIEGLKTQGVYDDTLIVLTSDHGEEFHEHGGWWHGSSLYVEQTQVPLVIKLPGGRLAGTRASWQVRALDVAPTIAGVVGVSPDPSWEGRDLLGPTAVAALSGVEQPDPRPVDPATACRLARTHRLDRVVVMEEDFEGNVLEAVRTGGFSLHLAESGGSRELPAEALFDVVADPGEQAPLDANGASICSQFPEDWSASLRESLELVKEAGGSGVQPEDVALTADQRAKLCALGYLTGEECR